MVSHLRGHRRLAAVVMRLGLIATGSYLLPFVHGPLWSQGQGMWKREVVAFSFATSGLAFLLLGAGTAARRPQRWLPWVLAAFWLSTASSFYATLGAERPGDAIPDNALLSSYSAQLMLLGKNPYVWDMGDAFSAFGASGFFMTPQLDGSATSVLPYPALHFLLLVPVHAFGLDGVRGLYVLCHLVMGTLLFLRAPGAIRPIVLLPLWVSAEYMGFALGFVSDGVWALLLLCTVLAWRDWRWRAVFYGLACAYKQPPWLLAPFILVRLLIDERDPDERLPIVRASAFFAVAAAVFTVFNGPFMLADFPAWAVRVLQPLTGHLVYLGVGLASLTQLGVVELPKPFYATASLVVTLTLLLVYTAHFQRFRHALWLFPGLMLWFSYRSLQSYFVYWIPLLIAVVVADFARGRGALPQAGVPDGGKGADDAWERVNRLPLRLAHYLRARRRWTLGVVAVACATILLAAVHFVRTTEAVAVELVDARILSPAADVGEMVLFVQNTTDSVLRPRFAVQRASWQPFPWDIVSGPISLAPGQSGHYRIRTDLSYRTLPLPEGGQLVVSEATGNYGVRGTLKIAPDDSFLALTDIFNSGYRLLSDGGPVPWGWTLQRTTPHEPSLERTRTADGAPAIRLGFQAEAGRAGWEGVGIAQGVPFPDGPLRIWANPPDPGDDGAGLTAAYGVEFHDGQKRLWVLFGPAPPGEGYLEPNHYYIRRPLPPGTWSEQSVDLGSIYARLGWPLPPIKRTIRGNVELLTRGTSVTLFVAARNRPRAQRLSGEFGPVHIEPGPHAPWDRIRHRVERPREYELALSRLEADRRNFDRARALLEKAQLPPD